MKENFYPVKKWIPFPRQLLLLLSLQSCSTLCDPIDGSPPGSPIPGILQARILERVAISFSNVWKWKVKLKLLSHVRLLATPWTAAYQAPPSMGFSRQEYWSGVYCLLCPRQLAVLKSSSPLSSPLIYTFGLVASSAHPTHLPTLSGRSGWEH